MFDFQDGKDRRKIAILAQRLRVAQAEVDRLGHLDALDARLIEAEHRAALASCALQEAIHGKGAAVGKEEAQEAPELDHIVEFLSYHNSVQKLDKPFLSSIQRAAFLARTRKSMQEVSSGVTPDEAFFKQGTSYFLFKGSKGILGASKFALFLSNSCEVSYEHLTIRPAKDGDGHVVVVRGKSEEWAKGIAWKIRRKIRMSSLKRGGAG